MIALACSFGMRVYVMVEANTGRNKTTHFLSTAEERDRDRHHTLLFGSTSLRPTDLYELYLFKGLLPPNNATLRIESLTQRHLGDTQGPNDSKPGNT